MINVQKCDLFVALAEHKKYCVKVIDEFINHIQRADESFNILQWMTGGQYGDASEGHRTFYYI